MNCDVYFRKTKVLAAPFKTLQKCFSYFKQWDKAPELVKVDEYKAEITEDGSIQRVFEIMMSDWVGVQQLTWQTVDEGIHFFEHLGISCNILNPQIVQKQVCNKIMGNCTWFTPFTCVLSARSKIMTQAWQLFIYERRRVIEIKKKEYVNNTCKLNRKITRSKNELKASVEKHLKLTICNGQLGFDNDECGKAMINLVEQLPETHLWWFLKLPSVTKSIEAIVLGMQSNKIRTIHSQMEIFWRYFMLSFEEILRVTGCDNQECTIKWNILLVVYGIRYKTNRWNKLFKNKWAQIPYKNYSKLQKLITFMIDMYDNSDDLSAMTHDCVYLFVKHSDNIAADTAIIATWIKWIMDDTPNIGEGENQVVALGNVLPAMNKFYFAIAATDYCQYHCKSSTTCYLCPKIVTFIQDHVLWPWSFHV